MGAKQATLKKSTVSEIEKRTWWKKQRIRKTKNKSVESSNGVLLQCEETTKEFRGKGGKDSYQYTKVVIKQASNGDNKSTQEKEKEKDLPQTSCVSENKINNTNSPSEFKMKQPQQESGQDSVFTLLHNSGYGYVTSISYDKHDALNSSSKKVLNDSRMGFNQRLGFIKSNVEKPYTESKSTENNVYSTDSSLLRSNETEINKQQCNLDSLLGANSKASSYDTELKAFNDSLCSQNHETQFMKKLSFDDKEVDGDSYSNNIQSLKYLKTVNSCDDEEAEHFLTSVKEVSSSYPDSDWYSDELSHRITLPSDESFSVSACGSNRCGPDSSILFKQADKYNDMPERHCQKFIHHSEYHVQSNADQIIDQENVIRTDKCSENSRSVIKCQSICGVTASNTKKIEHKGEGEGNICQTDNMKCHCASDVFDGHELSSNIQKPGEKSVQIEKGMPIKSVRCCESALSRDINQTTSCVFSAVIDFNKATVMVIYYYQCSALCTFLVLRGFYSSVSKAQYNVNPNVIIIIHTCKHVNEVHKNNSFLCIFVVVLCHDLIRNTAEVADSRKNFASSPGSSDTQISVVKFVWEEGQKLICLLYFLENIKRITLPPDSRKDNTMKERKQLADKEAILIYAGKVDSTEDEMIGKANFVQKSSLKNEYRRITASDRNFSAQNIEENCDQVEINTEISALQNQDNIAENQTVHTEGNEKSENIASCKTKALKSKETNDDGTDVSVEMIELNNNKNGEEIDSCQGDNKTVEEDNTVKERRHLADKEAILINAGKIDSTEDEMIGKANLVQKSLKNKYRGIITVSDRNFSAQNIEENHDQVEINTVICSLQNQDNITDKQTSHIEGNEKSENTASCKTKALKSKETADDGTGLSVEIVEINNSKNGEEIDSCQGDNKTMEEKLNSGLGVSKLVSDWFYQKLEGQRSINDEPEVADTKHDIKLSESVVKDSQKEIDEQSISKEGDESKGVGYLQSTDSETAVVYISSNSCVEPLAMNGVGVRSVDEVAIGSTKRMDKKGKHKIKMYKRKRNNKLINESTDQLKLSSAVKHVILSNKASRDGKQSLRKKYRFKKKRKTPRTAEDSDALKPSLGVKENYSKIIQPKEKDSLSKFCEKCHQQIHKCNATCRNCQSVRAEIETGMFHNHVSSFDSGIASMISSTRSSILSGMESVQNMTSEGSKETRKQVLNELFNLGLLNKQLQRITKSLNFDAIANVDHSVIAFPGLQSYFDSLRDGVTPSLQERMTYEWLRLMSFSSYNGGGSPVHLARGGFFHHQGNETRCFCCNVSYSNWTYTDDVQAVHRRISPDCPFVAQGVESNRNTPVENSRTENQSQPPATQQSVLTPSVSSTETPGSNSAAAHGGFSFGSAPGMTRMSQTGTPETTGGVPRFSFYPDPSAANSSQFHFTQATGQAAGGADISSQVTNQLSTLTIQQNAGAQQPTEEPISGTPVIVPTQPSQIARQTDGDAQLIVSAQQPPEANDTQQNTTGNQETSGASSSRPPPSGTESADILPIGTLKHPRYGSLNVRMSSFASWPSYLNQTPRQMAYAGFFHPGVADFARCFCCGGGLRNWEADDDPMVEHARWYPRCEYINKLKGTHFVQAVLRRHREHMAERQREQERSADNSFTSPDPMTTEVAARLLEMGFTQERAREAILTVRRLRGRSEVTAEEVTAWMLDDDNAQQSEPTRAVDTAGTRDTVRSEERSEQRNASPSSNSSGSLEPTVTTQGATLGNTESSAETQGAAGGGGDRQVETKTASNDKTEVDSSADEMAGSGKAESSTSEKSKSKKGKKSKSRKGHSPSGKSATSSHGDIDTKSLKEENKLLKQMQVCKICMDKYVSVTFLPCGHLVCCEECARSMRKCPICRKRIKGQVKTFMS